MQIVQGDLLALAQQGAFDVIVHGCNCHNTMGAGIAKSIKDKFPAAYEADLETEKGSREKLGTFTTATVEGNERHFVIVNAYTQYDHSGAAVLVDYDAIRNAFRAIKKEFAGQHIAYPMIGAGLGGGDWDRIARIIDEELDGETHTLVEYVPSS